MHLLYLPLPRSIIILHGKGQGMDKYMNPPQCGHWLGAWVEILSSLWNLLSSAIYLRSILPGISEGWSRSGAGWHCDRPCRHARL